MSLQKLSLTQQITLSFLLLIIIGSLLLAAPIAHYADAPSTSYLDHLFHAVSMVCVTGLSVFAVADIYNGFGQTIAIFLIQIGGLGLVSLIALSHYSLQRRLSLTHQTVLQSALNWDSHKDLKEYLFNVYKLTFAFEMTAALLLMIDFIPRFGIGNGIFNSFFLAISAFCNAGFDNLGNNSLIAYQTNTFAISLLALVILVASIGFASWINLITAFKTWLRQSPRSLRLAQKALRPQTKLILRATLTILLIGTLSTWFLERNNPHTIGQLSLFQQGLTSFFQAVTMRTAGIATIDYTQATHASLFIYILQMLIGGAPGSTAGGIKITVAAIAFLVFRAEMLGHSQVTFSRRSIPEKLILQTLTILITFFSILTLGFLFLLVTEPNHEPLSLFFEAVSAIATVGVSMNVTPHLSTAGRLIIMALMFFGRVGPITVLISLIQKQKQTIHYAPTNILLG